MTALLAQVAIVIQLVGGQATTLVSNSGLQTQQVSVALHFGHIAEQVDHATYVVLEREVQALVAPADFVLQPGDRQTIRVKLRESVPRGTTLRLVTTFTPVADANATPAAHLVQVTRFIAKAIVE